MGATRDYEESRKEKDIFEKVSGLKISDQTWRRYRKEFKELGVDSDNLPNFLAFLEINNEAKTFKTKYAPLTMFRYKEQVEALKAKMPNTVVTGGFFISLITQGKIAPKNRPTNGAIKYSTQWYRWFEKSGLRFKPNDTYSWLELLPVLALYLEWQQKKLKHSPQTDIINGEFTNE